MSKVGVASVANCFDPLQKSRSVEVISDYLWIDRLGEGRPSRVGFELLISIKQERSAAQARVQSGLKQAAHRRTERPLCPCLARDVILLVAELLMPLRVGLDDLMVGGRIAFFCEFENIRPFQHLTVFYLVSAAPGANSVKRAPFRRVVRERCGSVYWRFPQRYEVGRPSALAPLQNRPAGARRLSRMFFKPRWPREAEFFLTR